eukprot:s344_g35.t1
MAMPPPTSLAQTRRQNARDAPDADANTSEEVEAIFPQMGGERAGQTARGYGEGASSASSSIAPQHSFVAPMPPMPTMLSNAQQWLDGSATAASGRFAETFVNPQPGSRARFDREGPCIPSYASNIPQTPWQGPGEPFAGANWQVMQRAPTLAPGAWSQSQGSQSSPRSRVSTLEQEMCQRQAQLIEELGAMHQMHFEELRIHYERRIDALRHRTPSGLSQEVRQVIDLASRHLQALQNLQREQLAEQKLLWMCQSEFRRKHLSR